MITKNQLDQALEAWRVARERALHEQIAWDEILKNHKSLIDSLRNSGHTWSQANAEFENISNYHRDSLLQAWEAMDERCKEYQDLLKRFQAQP